MQNVFRVVAMVMACAFLASCGEKPPVSRNPAVVMAEGVAEKMNAIADALESMDDLETSQKGQAEVNNQCEALVALYAENKGLSMSSEVMSEINAIVVPASDRLSKVTEAVKAKHAENLPVKMSVLVSINKVAHTLESLKSDQSDQSN